MTSLRVMSLWAHCTVCSGVPDSLAWIQSRILSAFAVSKRSTIASKFSLKYSIHIFHLLLCHLYLLLLLLLLLIHHHFLLPLPFPQGETTWRTKDVLKVIEQEGESVAFIWLPGDLCSVTSENSLLIVITGVHYATGHVFDMKEITAAAHKKVINGSKQSPGDLWPLYPSSTQGCYVGFELAHAVGNIEMELHDWEVDVAAWCTYKVRRRRRRKGRRRRRRGRKRRRRRREEWEGREEEEVEEEERVG